MTDQPISKMRGLALLLQNFIPNFLYFVAAVDPEIIRKCPLGERLHALRLGMQILGGGTIIFVGADTGLTSALGPIHPSAVPAAAALVACLIVLLDTGILYSLWFSQGVSLANDYNLRVGAKGVGFAPTLLVGTFRLTLSCAVAWFFGVLIAIQLFWGDVKKEQLSTYRQANAALFHQIAPSVEADIAHRGDLRDEVTGRIKILQAENLTTLQEPDTKGVDKQISGVAEKIATLQKQILEADREANQRAADANCEDSGIKGGTLSCRPESSGRPHQGVRYEFAIKQMKLAIAVSKRASDDLAAAKSDLLALQDQRAAVVRDSQTRAAAKARLLESDIEAANEEYEARDREYHDALAAREKTISEIARAREGDYVPLKEGLLANVETLDAITRSPSVWLWVAMLKAVMVLLEASGVITKLWFPTSSRYSLELVVQFDRAARSMVSAVRLANAAAEREALNQEGSNLAAETVHRAAKETLRNIGPDEEGHAAPA